MVLDSNLQFVLCRRDEDWSLGLNLLMFPTVIMFCF